MKRFFLYSILFFLGSATYAQVSISKDNSAPHPSAMLDVKSDNQGVLLPKVSLIATNVALPVVNPAVGLMVYNTATSGDSLHRVHNGHYYWDGFSWIQVSLRKGTNIGDMQYWNGNSWVPVPVGRPGQYLQLSVQGIPTWTGHAFPTVFTLPGSEITDVSATTGGNIASDGGAFISERGVCWNMTGNPTVTDNRTLDGTGNGTYLSYLTGLAPGTLYFVRAYCTNDVGTVYGGEISFTTLTVPTVLNDSIRSITQTTAQGGGNVTSDGGVQVTARGLCWSHNPNPTIADSLTNDGAGTGTFVSDLTLLTTDAVYYVRAYAINSIGIGYSNEIVFSTLPPAVLPSVTTTVVSEITNTSAKSGGNVIFDGYSPITARGVCWSLNPNPTTNDNITSNGTGTGDYTSLMNGLVPDTLYYIRAYAVNSVGTSYGNMLSFRTLLPFCPGIPTITFEGNTYNTVYIGNQCWFRENLNAGIKISGINPQTDNEIIEKYCLNDLEANCNVFGGLYQWNELTNYVNLSGGKGICPQGWHVPSFSDLTTLVDFLGGASSAGGALKEKGLSHWSAPNTNASNTSGFTALPGSLRTGSGTFSNPGTEANLWASTIHASGFAALLLHYNSAEGDLVFYANNNMGFSARCIKDTCSSYSSVGVTIAPSTTQACSGIPVTFTATPVNGGETPFYQWKVNGIKSGTNAHIFTYIPENNDVVSCLLYSSSVCAANPAISNFVTMTVNPVLPVSLSIVASANGVCAGTSVTCTATPTNGGSNPLFQWKKGGVSISGATGSTYAYNPLQGDQISCLLTSNHGCVSGNPASSNSIIMTVNPLLPVSVTIAASSINVCAGTLVSYTATAVNGGSNPSFQWKKGGTSITGATSATYAAVPAQGDQITCLLTSSENCKTGSPATSNTIAMTVNPILPVSITISASATVVCAGTSVTFTAIPVNGGTTPGFLWKKGGTTISGATGTNYTYTPTQGDQISCVLTSNAICNTGSPATSNTLTMTVNPILPVSITIAASSTTVCAGTAVTFTTTPINGGTTPGYQWKKGGVAISGATSSTYSYTPANGDVVTCVLTSSLPCPSGSPANSNAITMTVNPILPVSVSIAASVNPSCAGTSVTFTATPVNGGTAPGYQWQLNGANISGATNSTYTKIPSNNNIFACVLTSSATCKSGSPATSNAITMTVTPIAVVSVSITASATTVCAGTSVTYTATPTNGGTSPSYQWRVDGTNVSGATNSTRSFIPASGDSVTCVLTSNTACASGNPATSNMISVTVNPLSPVSVSVSASSYAVMPGTTVTYTATPVNGGTSPSYQWKKNGTNVGSNNPVYTNSSPANNDNISCVITSNATICVSNNPATSNVVNMIVYSAGPACTVPTVVFGGMTYNTVTVGTQCWLRENVNLGTMINSGTSQTDNSIVEKYCYNNDPLSCNVYGGLYQWAEMVQYLNGVTNTTHWNPLPTIPVQGICPPGWHIPTTTEVATLITTLGGAAAAGGSMKETGLVHWGPLSNVGATNSFGFTALPAGSALNGSFSNQRANANFWTVTKGTLNSASFFFGASFASAYYTTAESTKIIANPVRCLKD